MTRRSFPVGIRRIHAGELQGGVADIDLGIRQLTDRRQCARAALGSVIARVLLLFRCPLRQIDFLAGLGEFSTLRLQPGHPFGFHPQILGDLH